jgi:hypothetical protein
MDDREGYADSWDWQEDEEVELTDSEIEESILGNYWNPEGEVIEDPYVLQEAAAVVPTDIPSLTPSKFTELAFMMPVDVGGGRMELRNFSFDDRRHMRRCYDTPSKRVLLMCGRQVEKSTLLGNISLCYSCMVPGFRTLYVAPSGRQADTFSKDRIKEPIDTSPLLRKFTTKMLSQNILEKQFVNRSKITLRYAFLNADRARGIPAWQLMLYELQDIMTDNIPVLEQCTSHAPEQWKRFVYSGTPKTLDNTIELFWSNNSTQNEWVVPCEGCNNWNVLGEENIGKKGLICSKCGRLINPQHPKSQWAAMAEMGGKVAFEGYRIPQLMVPWRSWKEIIIDYERYSRARFYNEVLGRSYDSGLRPLTQADLVQNCLAGLSMQSIERYRELSFGQSVYAGIDWGTGENSFTFLTLGTYMNGRMRAFYWHRFSGREVEPDVQMELIYQILDYFNVKLIGTDYGGGFHPNSKLRNRYGKQKVWSYQYVGQLKAKVIWDPKLMRFKVRRNEVMADIFNAIKKGGKVEFPNWPEFQKPAASDMLSIFSEYNETLKVIQYKHAKDKPDDAFHALLYMWLVSMLEQPRPDIIAPDKESRAGEPLGGYIMPADYGY